MTITTSEPTTTYSEITTRRAGTAGTWTALGVELRKLAAQKRARFALLGCLIAPIIVTVVLKGQQRPPKDTLYGRHIHDSGFAEALFVLTFAAQWLLPFLTALVAGDIFATEDHLGTWKTLLTRSASRTPTTGSARRRRGRTCCRNSSMLHEHRWLLACWQEHLRPSSP